MHHRSGLAALSAAAFLASLLAGCAKSSAPPLPPQAPLSRTANGPAAPGALSFKVFTAGSTPGFPASAQAWDITPGANGTIWFTDVQTPALGRIDAGGRVREYTALPPQSRPYSVVVGPGGTVWFTDAGTASLGRLNPDGTITEFTDPKLAGSYPQDLTMAPDRSIWFISVGPSSYLVRATQAGALTLTALPSSISADGSLIADTAGNLWYLAINAKGRGVLVQRRPDGTPVDHATQLNAAAEPCCPNLAPKRMTIGPDGNVWFTTLDYVRGNSPANWIVTAGVSGLTYYWVRNGGIKYAVYPSGIATTGSAIWFSGDDPLQANGGLWQMQIDGTMRAYPVPYNPAGLTADSAGALWFTSKTGGQPSQIVEATVK